MRLRLIHRARWINIVQTYTMSEHQITCDIVLICRKYFTLSERKFSNGHISPKGSGLLNRQNGVVLIKALAHTIAQKVRAF